MIGSACLNENPLHWASAADREIAGFRSVTNTEFGCGANRLEEGSVDEQTPVAMIRDDLRSLPRFELPKPYTLRMYEPGDAACWTEIQQQSDVYLHDTEGLFVRAFKNNYTALTERQFYLMDGAGRAIGTATAWFDNNYCSKVFGRVHWVAILPAMQGRGLSKPLMAAVCERLHELDHRRAYLTTAALRIPAIRLYVKFGFCPHIRSDSDRQAWDSIADRIK